MERKFLYGKRDNPMKRFDTTCCALGILSLNNDHTFEEIKWLIDVIKEETKQKWNISNRDGGERAISVITTPTELELEENLRQVGFNEIYTFNRRNGYPLGKLKMWIISW